MPVAPPGPALASKRVPTYDTAARPLAEEHGAGRFLKLRPRLLRQLRKSGSPLFPAAQDLQVSAAKPRPRPLIPRPTGTVGHPARSVRSVSVRPALTAAPRTPGPHPAPRTPGPSHSSPLPSPRRSSLSTRCVGPCALCGRAPSGPRSSDCCVPRAHDSAWRTEVGAQQIPSHEGSGRRDHVLRRPLRFLARFHFPGASSSRSWARKRFAGTGSGVCPWGRPRRRASLLPVAGGLRRRASGGARGLRGGGRGPRDAPKTTAWLHGPGRGLRGLAARLTHSRISGRRSRTER